METGDRRTQVSRDLREKVVKYIIFTLKKRTPPSEDPSSQLRKIHNIALKLEEKLYMNSSDEKEYVRKTRVNLMAAEGSHPNVLPKSSSNPPCTGLKALTLDQSHSVADQSADPSQACEVPEQYSLLDVQNNITCSGVSANLALAQSTVSASAQVKQEYIDLQQNHQQLTPNLCKQIKQEHVAPSCITQQHKVHQQQYQNPQQNHQQLKPNLCKQVKQEHVALPCLTQEHQAHHQQQHHHHHQQKVLKHTQQQIPQQSVIQAPFLRSSEMHVVPLSDRRQDQSSFKQRQSVINNNHQRAYGQTNPQDTSEIHHKVTPEKAQSQKQPHAMWSRWLTPNPQQNHLSRQSNGPCDLQQQHKRSQHNYLLQEFKGQSLVHSSTNHDTQKSHISVPHGSSQLPEGGSSGKHQCENKMQGETRQTDFTLLPNQVQESQPPILERQLKTQSQSNKVPPMPSSGRMQISDIPASTHGNGISNVDKLQEELYQKVQNLKSKYLASLAGMEQKIAFYFQKLQSLPDHPERSNIKKLKSMKHMHYMVKCYIGYLNVPKNKISPACKEKVGLLEEKIVSVLHILQQRKPSTLLQDGKPSKMHSMTQSVQLHSQDSQGHTREDEKKLPPQLANIQCLGTDTQHSNLTNVMNDSDSLSEPPIQQHDTVHIRQNLTERDLKKANSLKSVNQVTLESNELLRRSPQEPKTMMSQNSALGLQSHVDPLESSFSTLQDMHLKYTNEQTDIGTSNQELQRHKSQQQLVQPNKQISQQHHSAESRTPNLLPESLKPSSRQVLQHSSVSEKKNSPMLPIEPKSSVIWRSSLKAGISSLAPSTSAPMQGYSEKPMPEPSLVKNAVNMGGQQASFDGLNAAGQPIQRLIKMVNLMSGKALSSFASDIGSVVCMADRVSRPDTVQRSGAAISHLADTTNFHVQKRYFARQEMTVESRTMKRPRSTSISFGDPENASTDESLSQLSDMENSELDSSALSYRKRRRVEVNRLLEEITTINQRLIDTVLDISDEETMSSVSAPILNGEGTIVRCSFIAMAFTASLKAELELLPIQPLRLLVPAKYPLCSPIFVDKLKVEVSDDQDLSAKVKSKLILSLRNLTEPLSLGEIARTWDICARTVIYEYAEQNGGGSFSSKYGTWEDCRSAAAA